MLYPILTLRQNSRTGDPFQRMRADLDALFGLADKSAAETGAAPTPGPAPASAVMTGGLPVSIRRDDEHVFVAVDLPGVTDNDVEITFHEGKLTIEGERKSPDPENVQYLWNQRVFGKFRQVISLSDDIDSDNVVAKLENGVLHISLNRRPELKPKKIALTPHS